MTTKLPVILIIPGAGQNPSHYGYLSHLLQKAGYPIVSALLPSIGASPKVTVSDDSNYIRDKLLLPILDHQEHDVIMLMHSYGSVPGSAAARGLSKTNRAKQGKSTGVIGQVYLAALLIKGGDEKSVMDAFGGQYPPHVRPDHESDLLHVDDPIPPFYHDVPENMVSAVAASVMTQSMTSLNSPCPPATWDSDEYQGRLAYIKTLNDVAVPAAFQQMMLDGTGVDWVVKDIESGHSPQISKSEELTDMIVELARGFELS